MTGTDPAVVSSPGFFAAVVPDLWVPGGPGAMGVDLDGIFMVSRSGRHDRDVTWRYPSGVSPFGVQRDRCGCGAPGESDRGGEVSR